MSTQKYGKIVEAWAMIRPNGTILTDGFESAEQAWKIGLGWPDDAEIEAAKRSGYRVARVRLLELLD